MLRRGQRQRLTCVRQSTVQSMHSPTGKKVRQGIIASRFEMRPVQVMR
jgi:hypothetical protein